MPREPWDTEPLEQPGSRVDVMGVVQDDVACLRCGQTLRGLPLRGFCPECATPVAASVQGDLLRHTPPEWIGKIANGANWYLAALVIGFVGSCVAGGVDEASGNTLASSLMAMAALGVTFYAVWLLTSPEPGSELQGGWTTGRFTRSALMANLAVGVGGLAVPAQDITAMLVVMAVQMVVSSVMFFALLLHVERLALRIPDVSLSASTRAYRWFTAILSGITLVGGAVVVQYFGPESIREFLESTDAAPPNPEALAPAVAAMLLGGCAMVIAFLVALVWGLVILVQHRNAYASAARFASGAPDSGWA